MNELELKTVDQSSETETRVKRNETRTIVIQVILFLTTIVTTTMAGAELCFGRSIASPDYSWDDFSSGFQFSIPLLLVLTVHEFGHYFTALYHRLKVSLPYYLPVPLVGMLHIGTLGAVIRIRSKVNSNLQHFDVGIAGPLAGFVVALGVLWYGFATLPPPEYVFQFHPEYKTFGLKYADTVYSRDYILSNSNGALMFMLGDNLLFRFFIEFIADPARVPNPHEMMHYPILMAGFISLFFTALNLLPIGQLDGGHVIYGLFGKRKHSLIASVAFVVFVFYAGLGAANVHTDGPDTIVFVVSTVMFNFFCLRGFKLPFQDTLMYALIMFAVQFILTTIFPEVSGYRFWCVFALLIGNFIGIHHPVSEIENPLDGKRILLGWLCLAVFVLSFSPTPFIIEVIAKTQ